MSEFKKFQQAISKQFELMCKHELFRVDVSNGDPEVNEKEVLYATYLGGFTPGTNPVFKNRTEHDCQCCKQFIRAVGNVVAIIDKKVVSIWDIKIDNFYQNVADTMSKMIHESPIVDKFLHTEATAGTESNKTQASDKSVIVWNHFFLKIPKENQCKGDELGTRLSEYRSTKDAFFRSLTELTMDSLETIQELIAQNSLYRGEEKKWAIDEFIKLKKVFDLIKTESGKHNFCWYNLKTVSPTVAKLRSDVIGTLLEHLSEGKELEWAVNTYEKKVAGDKYKRPTALVTKAMIEKAQETIKELGLVSALERRFATVNDITVNNLVYVDRNVKAKLEGDDIFDTMKASVPESTKNLDRIEEVTIEEFITNILPKATSVEVLLENRHEANLVSLIAPLHADSKNMFKWPNRFSWSYSGEMADSLLRSTVQARGGQVDGAFRFSHTWNYDKRNASLMDLHVFMPANKNNTKNDSHDRYGNDERVGWNHRNHYASGGTQDVDYTAPAPEGYIPVENITFPSLEKMPEGVYICKIHNWQLRGPTDGGFKAEIEFGGEVFQYEVDRALKNKEWVTVASVTLKKGQFTIEHHLPMGSAVKNIWKLPTQSFHRVQAMMMSPNYWDDNAIGNKHYFFMLEGCTNESKARGFFNEFLSSELDVHRKVLEIVGSKMKTDESDKQLSGIGFSSTPRNSVTCRVNGKFKRVVKVTF